MVDLNIQYKYIPNSLLELAKDQLGPEFSKLPKRIQSGYIALFLGNRHVEEKNQHKTHLDCFKLGSDDLVRLFGSAQTFRNVNQNGYCMKSRRTNSTTDQGKFTYCKSCNEEGAKHYPPLALAIQVYTGHNSKQDNDKGLLSAYQLTNQVTELIDTWLGLPMTYNKNLRFVTDLKGKLFDSNDLYAKGINRRRSTVPEDINVRRMVNISLNALLMYKVILLVAHDYVHINGNYILTKDDKHNKVLKKNSNHWNVLASDILNADHISEEIYKNGLDGIKRHKDLSHEKDRDAIRRYELSNRIGKNSRQGGGDAKEPIEGTPPLVVTKVTDLNSRPVRTLLQDDFSLLNIRRQLRQIEYLIAFLRETGVLRIPIEYEECGTGRYFTSTLQGYQKEIRYAALKGCYGYDIEAAHQNILLQIMDRERIQFPELSVMQEYVDNKKSIRNQLAQELDTTIPIVKSILQIFTYGSRSSESFQEGLYSSCNEDLELVRRVKKHQWIQDYRNAFVIALGKIGKEDRVNAIGIKGDKNKNKKSQKMAHILQGYERQVLDAIMHYSEFGDTSLLLHDCVVFNGRVNPQEISQVVREETGFNLSFEEELY